MNSFQAAALVAAIDLGSNTVRLLAAYAQKGPLARELYHQAITRLGEGLLPGKTLFPAAVDRTWRTLEQFRDLALSAGAETILAGATMAVRQAADGADFLARIEQQLGIRTRLLSGDQEADLTAAGVLAGLNALPERAVIFDLGGRSTEFIVSHGRDLVKRRSLEIGAVHLTEAFIDHDPPTGDEIRRVEDEAAGILKAGLADFRHENAVELIGTAGTVTTLAAMMQSMAVYLPERINYFKMGRSELNSLFERMRRATAQQRGEMPGLEPGRADIIVAGAAAVRAIMKFFNVETLTVSDAGLLEGIWLAAAGQRSI